MLPPGLEKPLESAVTPDKPRRRASAAKATKTNAVAKKTPVVNKSKVAAPSKVVAAVAPEIAHQDITHQDIAKIAYHLWEARGYTGGSPDDDWYLAEAYLRERKVAS